MKYFVPKDTIISRSAPRPGGIREWEGATTEYDVCYSSGEVVQNSGCMIFQLPNECHPYDLMEVFRTDVQEFMEL